MIDSKVVGFWQDAVVLATTANDCRHVSDYYLGEASPAAMEVASSCHMPQLSGTAKTGSPSLLGGKANDGQRAAPLRLATMRCWRPDSRSGLPARPRLDRRAVC